MAEGTSFAYAAGQVIAAHSPSQRIALLARKPKWHCPHTVAERQIKAEMPAPHAARGETARGGKKGNTANSTPNVVLTRTEPPRLLSEQQQRHAARIQRIQG